MSTRERRERSDAFDKELSELFRVALLTLSNEGLDIASQVTLAAVGGYGRGELSPGSDLDIVLIHSGVDETSLGKFVNALLYPIWDRGLAVDYSVRTRAEMRTNAAQDLKVALGQLDLRLIIGDSDLVDGIRDENLIEWRKKFPSRIDFVRASIEERSERSGELAYLLEPDLKEARGGLRDINALKAIANSGYIDLALNRITAAEAMLLNVRDSLHLVSGRNRDQLLLTEQDKVARDMNFPDADALMLEVARSARAVDYLMSLAWQEIDRKSLASWRRRIFPPKPASLARGLVVLDDEVFVEPDYQLENDPGIILRAAAITAQRGLVLSIEALDLFATKVPELGNPWPRSAREDLVSLIGAGAEMIPVFEALDQEGLIEKLLPEWSHVRFLPQRNVLHRHTVDRHMLETAVRAATLTRTVHRPDLLLVGALMHDIGKGYAGKDHSDYGAELITALAVRLGFDAADGALLGELVQHHLLLPAVATRRDLADPQTISYVAGQISSAEALELLHALSISDGEATGRTAWSNWKAGLVADLVHKVRALMAGEEFAAEIELTSAQMVKAARGELDVELEIEDQTIRIEIVAPDRTGLLSTVAGVLAISRMDVRSARTRTAGDVAVMNWLVALDAHAPIPEVEILRQLLAKALAGEVDLNLKIADRIRHFKSYPGIPVAAPVVRAINDQASNATVLEVRMHDRPGLLYNVAKVISRFGVDIRGAIVATLGAEAFDTLYITDLAGAPLSGERAALLANQVENFLLTD